MLSPEQLKSLPDNVLQLIENLEDFIIADIARRLGKMKDLTDTAQIQLEIAEAMKTSLPRIKTEIKRTTDLAIDEIEHIFQEETVRGLNFENAIYKKAGFDPVELSKSPALLGILDEGVRQTKGELTNFTQSLGFAYEEMGEVKFKPIAQFYQESLDNALLKVRTGATDYNTAVRQAVHRMADKGLTFVDYKTGHINRLDVATRRAVLTGANQMNQRMTEQIIDDLGAEYVETSAHSGARPDHQVWQGKVFHIGGRKNGYLGFEETCHPGDVTGIGGANCRHSYFPFFPGISTRTYTDEQLANIDPPDFEFRGEKYTHYEATQVQRQMETDMRKLKREIIGADASGDKQYFQNKSIKLNLKKQDYREFSNAANLKYQFERSQVQGFGHSIASKSSWNVRRALKDNSKSNIIFNRDGSIKNLKVGRKPVTQLRIDESIYKNLINIRFSSRPLLDTTLKDAGMTIGVGHGRGRKWKCERIESIKIGAFNSTDLYLLDTLVHEELEARIMIRPTKKHTELNRKGDRARHQYIYKVISRYFKWKGLIT